MWSVAVGRNTICSPSHLLALGADDRCHARPCCPTSAGGGSVMGMPAAVEAAARPHGAGLPGFVPADHVRVLHPEGRRGVATVARGGERWTEKAIPVADLAPYVAGMTGKTDVF